MNNKKSKLIFNTLIFAIGNFGTKFSVFLLIPIYTSYLSVEEYGMVDVITITITLLIPLLTMSIQEGVLKYILEGKSENSAIFSSGFFIILLGISGILLFYPIINNFLVNINVIFIYLTLISQIVLIYISQYLRAKGNVIKFMISGFVQTFVLIISMLYFLVFKNMGLDGYLIGVIASNLVTIIYILTFGNMLNDFKISKINVNLTKNMLIYSIPLIPNALMWWVMGLSDRYMIITFLGAAANGIYAVANKIPMILTVMNTIFFQAWQMATLENKEDAGEFYSDVFKSFSAFMFLILSILLLLTKPLIGLLVSQEFHDSWRYVPFLLFAILFSSFSGFFGTQYLVRNETKQIFKTSLLGAGLNITFNLFLIPIIGLYGATISTLLSFLIVWLIRVYDVKRFLDMKINWFKIIFTLILIIFQSSLMFLEVPSLLIIQLGIFLCICKINTDFIKDSVLLVKLKLFKRY